MVAESAGAIEGPSAGANSGVRCARITCLQLLVPAMHGPNHSITLVWHVCRAAPSHPTIATEGGVAGRGSPLVRPDAEWDKMKALLKQRDDEISIHTALLGSTYLTVW